MKAETHVNELVAAGLATVAGRGKSVPTDKGREAIKQYGDEQAWLLLTK